MNDVSSRRALLTLVILLLPAALAGCRSSDLPLEVYLEDDELVFSVNNMTGTSLNANPALLDTAKSPDGDFRLLVFGPAGESVPLCGMITNHTPTRHINLDPGAVVEFREDAALVRSVYCLQGLAAATYAVEYGAVESGEFRPFFRSNMVGLTD